MANSKEELKLYWSERLSINGRDKVYSMDTTRDGSFILAGETELMGSRDILVIKSNDNGEILWQRVYKNSGNDFANSIMQTKEGGYIIAGYTATTPANQDALIIKLSHDGSIEWSKIYGGNYSDWANSIKETEDGYVFVG